MICQSHAAQLIALNGRKYSMNQATFHSTFPIFLITKIFRYDKIMNPAFLSFSGINSTRNEDGGKGNIVLKCCLIQESWEHFLLNVGMQFIPLSYLFVCRPYLSMLIRTIIIA